MKATYDDHYLTILWIPLIAVSFCSLFYYHFSLIFIKTIIPLLYNRQSILFLLIFFSLHSLLLRHHLLFPLIPSSSLLFTPIRIHASSESLIRLTFVTEAITKENEHMSHSHKESDGN